MAFKKLITNIIVDEFPGLDKSKFYIFGNEVKYKQRDKLLPYLILKNTLDNNQRAILTYLDKKSEHYKLIPFFVSIGLAMRSKISSIEPNETWKKEEFYINGSASKFLYYNVITSKFCLKQGVKQIEISFDEFQYGVKTYNPESHERVKQLYEFIKQQKLDKQDTLSKHLIKLNLGENSPDGGLLLVTRKGKFKQILSSLLVDDKKLTDLIDIKETKWNKGINKFEFVDLSRIKNIMSKPLVLVADYNDFGSISTFIEEYPHITSVVFDDASDFIKKFKTTQFDRFKTHFLSLPEFRDLYFVLNESDIENKNFFQSLVSDIIPVHNWMTTSADINDSFEPNLINVSLVNNINQVPFSVSRACFQELLSNGFIDIILPFYNEFKDFIKRWNSFYDKDDIKLTAKKLSETLDNLIMKNKERMAYVEIITDRIKDQLSSFQIDNLKFEEFKLKLENINRQDISKVYLMSENTSVMDQNYLIHNIPTLWSEKIEFIEFDETFKFEKDSIIFAFGSHKNFSSHILYNFLEAQIHFILDCKDLWYFRLTYFRTVKLLNNVLDTNKRRELLNLQEDSDFQNESLPFPILNGLLNELNKVCVAAEKDSPDHDLEGKIYDGLDFLEFLKGEEKETSQTTDYSRHDKREIGLRIIGMDDGSSKIYEKSKYVFAIDSFDEDDEFASMKDAVDKLKKRVNDLNEGDYILELPEDKPNDLQKFVENQIESSFVLKNLNSRSESWRKALNMIYKVMGGDIGKFKSLLGKHIQRSEQTFKNWLEGSTMVPNTDRRDNEDVLKTISDIVNTDSRFKHIKFVYDENLRGQMEKMKSIKVNAPKMLLKRAVYKRINLRVEIEDTDQREFIKSLSKLIEVKQIKTIQDI